MTAATPHIAQSQPTPAVVQARASVRIVSGARISLSGDPNSDTPPPTQSVVHTEGTAQPARLIEFE